MAPTTSNILLFMAMIIAAALLTIASSLLVRRITAHFTGNTQVASAEPSTK